jgi:hypothetical protein
MTSEGGLDCIPLRRACLRRHSPVRSGSRSVVTWRTAQPRPRSPPHRRPKRHAQAFHSMVGFEGRPRRCTAPPHRVPFGVRCVLAHGLALGCGRAQPMGQCVVPAVALAEAPRGGARGPSRSRGYARHYADSLKLLNRRRAADRAQQPLDAEQLLDAPGHLNIRRRAHPPTRPTTLNRGRAGSEGRGAGRAPALIAATTSPASARRASTAATSSARTGAAGGPIRRPLGARGSTARPREPWRRPGAVAGTASRSARGGGAR